LARKCSTICLPIDQPTYETLVADPEAYRVWLDSAFAASPELFPAAFARGFSLKDTRVSKKTGLRTRRVRVTSTGESFSVRPAFVLPYQTALAPDAEKALFLRAFGVPFWAITRVFGRDHMYWYRLEVALGRNSIAGTTARKADLPKHLLADEHHTSRGGDKSYVALTVGGGCVLGAELTQTAGAEDLTAAYGVFKAEAEGVEPGYAPETVNADGWAATHLAWATLFPLAAVLRCFLHGWLALRSRGKLNPLFAELSRRYWEAFAAPCRRAFAQRMRRLLEWAKANVQGEWLLAELRKVCGRTREYGQAYAHPGGHRTSNMLDRAMRPLREYLHGGLHLHGSAEAAGLHVRAWALLANFRPWHPNTTRANADARCPAERLNGHRYHDDWLQNLLVSASLAGFRR
jgi:hypothetical protein